MEIKKATINKIILYPITFVIVLILLVFMGVEASVAAIISLVILIIANISLKKSWWELPQDPTPTKAETIGK